MGRWVVIAQHPGKCVYTHEYVFSLDLESLGIIFSLEVHYSNLSPIWSGELVIFNQQDAKRISLFANQLDLAFTC